MREGNIARRRDFAKIMGDFENVSVRMILLNMLRDLTVTCSGLRDAS
jgi:hypothetical protein